jgi:1,4-alpha-glucan branching enzyme
MRAIMMLLLSLLLFIGVGCSPLSHGLHARSPGFTNGTLNSNSTAKEVLTICFQDVIIQMFEWNWDSLAAECKNFIGPAGYGFVQASPPQEHIQGSQWWTDYQPVSYILTSKRGNRAQFQNMINTCHAAGVKVISDTLWNHMTGTNSGTGTAGSCEFLVRR